MNNPCQLSVIIVENDQTDASTLKQYISRIPFLNLLTVCRTAIDALDLIYIKKPDIIIVDVNLPMMSGLELISGLTSQKPQIILTSAHQQYAFNGFELDVTDFLLKPFDYQRFIKAICKVKQRHYNLNSDISVKELMPKRNSLLEDLNTRTATKALSKEERFIWVKVDKKMMNLNTSEIVYVEGLRDYVKIHLAKMNYVVNLTMTKTEELLGNSSFIRVNRSFIINKSFIICVKGNTIETSLNNSLPIGVNYKDAVKQLLFN
ncbi:two component transcriptional regulator, LytTR family [Mucilaginibacter sp. OK268]|jgi:DNA-binding LytR/AlgR family response regulator|uniref:LytR/AlgR family response regulator transcription factor n=1 Tax=Mucilaginibacter sp. OK268 TaxID=1881048 RepID=UPI00088C31AD|nr:LytTR family DNA-binding domain-containing protein [Mucilaginibacter sp. OK268]SDP98291.1 two component transcriptional regulator, LytTR family [Mucilaginibacter sp. OK268]